jgi:transposase InsO family protein
LEVLDFLHEDQRTGLQLVSRVESSCGEPNWKKIRVLRSDNGGEYTSKEFMDFCAGEGIRRDLTVPYNLQQNGVAERKNRAIVGATRAMLHDQGMPLFLWVEACYTAVYLQNMIPHKAVGSMTPEEDFSGKNPEVGHLCIFGCITYSHVPSEKRTKSP